MNSVANLGLYFTSDSFDKFLLQSCLRCHQQEPSKLGLTWTLAAGGRI